MSASTSFVSRASAITAREALRKRWLTDPEIARQVVPVALFLFLQGLDRETRKPFGLARVSKLLRRCPEDLLTSERRLAAADVRARGDVWAGLALKRGKTCAVEALAEFASVDEARAREVLSMAAAAAVSAMAKSKRELHLNRAEFRGVIKSEAAHVEGADLRLSRDLWRNVRRAQSLFQIPVNWLLRIPVIAAFHALARPAPVRMPAKSRHRTPARPATPRPAASNVIALPRPRPSTAGARDRRIEPPLSIKSPLRAYY